MVLIVKPAEALAVFATIKRIFWMTEKSSKMEKKVNLANSLKLNLISVATSTMEHVTF